MKLDIQKFAGDVGAIETSTPTSGNLIDETALYQYHTQMKSYVTGKVSGKQNSLSTAQLNACNSGITSTKVSTYDGYATSKQDKISDTGWVNITLASDVSVGTLGGTPQYRKVGNHVFIRGGYKGTKGSGTLTLGTLPTGVRPLNNVYDFNSIGGTRIARTYVNTSGNIVLEWVWTLQANPAAYTGAFDWVNVEMDFWVD